MTFHEWCSCFQLCKHVCKTSLRGGLEGEPHLKLLLIEVLPLLPLNLQGLNMVEEVGQDGLQGNFLSVLLLLHDLWPADARATKSPTRAFPHHIAGGDFLKQLPITAGQARAEKWQKTNKTRTETALEWQQQGACAQSSSYGRVSGTTGSWQPYAREHIRGHLASAKYESAAIFKTYGSSSVSTLSSFCPMNTKVKCATTPQNTSH